MVKEPKADVILFFDLPGGKESLVVKFWGADLERAIDTASDPYKLPAIHVQGTVEVFQKWGYEAWQNRDRDFQSFLCVRKGFRLDTARAIARRFMHELAAQIREEFKNG